MTSIAARLRELTSTTVDPSAALDMLPAPDKEIGELSIDELSKAISAIRALRAQRPAAGPVSEKPRVAVPKIQERTARIRAAAWCKVAEDGFTATCRPAIHLRHVYDAVVTVPTERHWIFFDPMVREDVVRDTLDMTYPCTDPELVARDITWAWQLYHTGYLDAEDSALLANTPVAVMVDGRRPHRYHELWAQVRPSAHWVARAGVVTRVD